jgi:FMN-dependent NADH-azoreductase
MSTLLHIDSSPMGETSVTRTLTQQFVREWRNVHPAGRILSRDLAAIDIPVVDANWISANFTPKAVRTAEQNKVLRLSTEFTTQLLTADEYCYRCADA